MENKKNIIYHYCSFETFMSILSNKKIWLSDIFKMNDWSEENYLEYLLLKYLKGIKDNLIGDKKYIRYLENQDKNNFFNLNKKTKEYDELFYRINLFLIKNRLLKLKSTSFCRYICCFSKKGDLLSQWRAYANDGRGFAIGFDVDILKELLKDTEIRLEEVEYIQKKDKIKKSELKKFEKKLPQIPYIDKDQELKQMIKESIIVNSDDDFLFSIDFSFFLRHILTNIMAKSYFDSELEKLSLQRLKKLTKIKSSVFSEELEYRIIMIEDKKNSKSKNIKFRKSKNENNLIRYQEFSLDCQGVIAEIIIGPKNNTSPKELLEYLKQLGSDNSHVENVYIRKSDIPYI